MCCGAHIKCIACSTGDAGISNKIDITAVIGYDIRGIQCRHIHIVQGQIAVILNKNTADPCLDGSVLNGNHAVFQQLEAIGLRSVGADRRIGYGVGVSTQIQCKLNGIISLCGTIRNCFITCADTAAGSIPQQLNGSTGHSVFAGLFMHSCNCLGQGGIVLSVSLRHSGNDFVIIAVGYADVTGGAEIVGGTFRIAVHGVIVFKGTALNQESSFAAINSIEMPVTSTPWTHSGKMAILDLCHGIASQLHTG